MRTYFCFLILFVFVLDAKAEEIAFWRCEQTQVNKDGQNGAFQSVQLFNNGSLFRMLFTYKPNKELQPGLPELNQIELVRDLHCRFYLNSPRLVQCVSTNFKRYVETVVVEESDSVLLSIKSDFLKWPIEYSGIKTEGEEQLLFNFSDPQNGFCGFVNN